MTYAWLMLTALVIEAAFGWPGWLDRRIGHPVRWFGWLVTHVDRGANRNAFGRATRIAVGASATIILVGLAALAGAAIERVLPSGAIGVVAAAIIASTLIASRSLFTHVAAVRRAFTAGDPGPARNELAMIVGRDTQDLDEAAIARAALESLAENTSDGVIAPAFWGALFGLPGLFAYKAINTLDSMIGHRNAKYEAFGKCAARLDDLANLVPARLTGALFALCALSPRAAVVMRRYGGRHRSPNAGWPEAAMAGALSVRLSGPRRYGDVMTDDAWLNPKAGDPNMKDIGRALVLYGRVIVSVAFLLATAGWATA